MRRRTALYACDHTTTPTAGCHAVVRRAGAHQHDGDVERVCAAVVAAGHAAVRAAAGRRATTGSRLGCGVICRGVG